MISLRQTDWVLLFLTLGVSSSIGELPHAQVNPSTKSKDLYTLEKDASNHKGLDYTMEEKVRDFTKNILVLLFLEYFSNPKNHTR